jgi:23S rRNA (cytosine1962-C5)-methyltransferase
MTDVSLETSLTKTFDARKPLMDAEHKSALRLFAGFYEGDPNLVVDVYGCTLLLTSYAEDLTQSTQLLENVQQFAQGEFPWLTCVVQKHRFAGDPNLKRGWISHGEKPDAAIVENGVTYALDLTMNQDASFYLDTRNLRAWLKDHSQGLSVLNTFAYTGSLGVAALAGKAAKVVQVDRNGKFLELARTSAMLNYLDLGRMKLRTADFFSEVGKIKRENELFDVVVVDPPFFSITEKGKVDQVTESVRMINKVRPLVKDGGRIIAINNALFLSGQDYMDELQSLSSDGYLTVEETILVPEEITGFPNTIVSQAPVDPAPFNHSTKIVVLQVKRKMVKS